MPLRMQNILHPNNRILLSIAVKMKLGLLWYQIAVKQFFSVLADETTYVSTKSQLAICVRFVDHLTSEIREEFLGYIEIPNTEAETIADAILSNLNSWGIKTEQCRGQGYDGRSSMSSPVNGVSGIM